MLQIKLEEVVKEDIIKLVHVFCLISGAIFNIVWRSPKINSRCHLYF